MVTIQMRFRKLRKLGANGDRDYGVTLPADELEHYELIDENGERVNEDQQLVIESVGGSDEPEWRIRACQRE